MDSHQQQQQNRNAATSTSQAVHNRPSVGALSLRQPQPLMLDASPYSVATQQPGIEKRARGRPRKYDPPPPPPLDNGGDSGGLGANPGPPAKRKGRPLGSRNKQRNALGEGEGGSFTAQVININAGEDIAAKLLAFMDQEPRHACILSASGAVSIAMLQTLNPLGIAAYEGLFDIISISGTFLNTETVARTADLRVSLAGPDYMVVGGRLDGMLVAGSPVQVVVGTFEPERVELSTASAPANALSESSEENALGNSTPPHYLPLWPGNNPQ